MNPKTLSLIVPIQSLRARRVRPNRLPNQDGCADLAASSACMGTDRDSRSTVPASQHIWGRVHTQVAFPVLVSGRST